MQLCGSLNILWHCPSLVLEWKPTFSSLVATAEFSKFARILSVTLSQHQISSLQITQHQSLYKIILKTNLPSFSPKTNNTNHFHQYNKVLYIVQTSLGSYRHHRSRKDTKCTKQGCFLSLIFGLAGYLIFVLFKYILLEKIWIKRVTRLLSSDTKITVIRRSRFNLCCPWGQN